MFFKTLGFFLISLLLSLEVYALQVVDINRGKREPMNIAINNLEVIGSNLSDNLANEFTSVIRHDLTSSGLFHTPPAQSFLEQTRGIEHRPILSQWRKINIQLLLNTTIQQTRGQILAKIVLWDIITGKIVLAEAIEGPLSAWRRVAHKVADKVYEKITGNPGYFDTQIIYIAETGPASYRIKRLALMDFDGANHKFLTDGKHLTLTPRFSHKKDQVLYLSYDKGTPKVRLKDLKNNKDKIIGRFQGMSFAPRFSPDDSHALLSIANHGNTNIFEINLRNNKLIRLTNELSINTSPTYSPDGSKIYFNSDRSGSKQLYSMNRDGSDVRRISFGPGSYSAPVCSPTGEYVAFTKVIRGAGFFIGIMKTDGSEERLIARGYLVEGAAWAPSGKLLVFARSYLSKNTGEHSQLYIVDLDSQHEYLLPTPQAASDPDWISY